MPKDPQSSGKPKSNVPQGPSKRGPLSGGSVKYTPPSPPRQPVSRPLSQPPAPRATGNPPPVGGMASANPVAERLSALQADMQALQEQVAFSNEKRSIADLDQGIGSLSQVLTEVRQRGYRYKGFLEGKVEVLAQKWESARALALGEMQQAERDLQLLYGQVSQRYSLATQAVNSPSASSQLSVLEQQIGQLHARLEAAQSTITAAYSGVQQVYNQTNAQVKEVLWLLDQVDQASFDILAGENPVQAVKAKWWRDGKNQGPAGVLYLTDQRLIFEQKEEKVTKKVLFIATEKEMYQEMLFQAPIGTIEGVKSSSKGLFGHEDHLDFTFGSGAEYPTAHFHIDGQESDFWVGLIKRVQTGEINSERYYAPGESVQAEAQALQEAFANAPQRCTACGAPFDAPIAKGQRQIKCEYCGTLMTW